MKIETVNAQVDEAKEVVNQNLELMMERGEKLEDLEHKTGNKKLLRKYLISFIFSGNYNRSRSLPKEYKRGRQETLVEKYSSYNHFRSGSPIDYSRYSYLFHIR